MIVTRKMAEAARLLLMKDLSDEELEQNDATVQCMNADKVNALYRAAVKRAHPDAGGSPEAFAAVDRAKHVLLEWLKRQSGAPPPMPDDTAPRRKCHMCNGKGYMMQQRGFRALRVSCGACRGTGDLDTEHDLGDGR